MITPNARKIGRSVLILGTARSGTTWIAQILASPFRYRLLFEPFQPDCVEEAYLVADKYYNPQNIPEEIHDFIGSVFNGGFDANPWVSKLNFKRFGLYKLRFWPTVRIVKSVRTNLLIPAYREMFDDNVPILAILRHPGAVLWSIMRNKAVFKWFFDISTLLKQYEYFERYGINEKYLTKFSNTPWGRALVRWVIENYMLIKTDTPIVDELIFYEQLVSEPKRYIYNICRNLGLKYPNKLQEMINVPSHTASYVGYRADYARNAYDFMNKLPKEHVSLMYKVLDTFEIEYPLTPKPNI